jgi:putative endonuclease
MIQEKRGYVYILASRKDGALYIGVTSNLAKRVWEHKENVVRGHTYKYNIKQLFYYEVSDDMENAILREKRIKTWKRDWKIQLIEGFNPEWRDLYEEIAN